MASWKKNPVYHGDDLSGFVDPNWCCSNCGGRAPIVIGLGLYDLVDTCPHCGEPMYATDNHVGHKEENKHE